MFCSKGGAFILASLFTILLIALLANFALSILLHSFNDLFENLVEISLLQLFLLIAIWALAEPEYLPRPAFLSFALLAPALIEFALSHTRTTLFQRWGLGLLALAPAVFVVMIRLP